MVLIELRRDAFSQFCIMASSMLGVSVLLLRSAPDLVDR